MKRASLNVFVHIPCSAIEHFVRIVYWVLCVYIIFAAHMLSSYTTHPAHTVAHIHTHILCSAQPLLCVRRTVAISCVHSMRLPNTTAFRSDCTVDQSGSFSFRMQSLFHSNCSHFLVVVIDIVFISILFNIRNMIFRKSWILFMFVLTSFREILKIH